MAKLLFTPRTTIDANVFQFRLDNSHFNAKMDIKKGNYVFEVNQNNIEQLEDDLNQEITYDIQGRFEIEY